MSTATLSQVRPATSETALSSDVAGEARRSHRAAPLLAMLAGLVVLSLAATVLIGARGGVDRVQGVSPEAALPAPVDSLAITLAARDVSVVTQVYAPGQDSGWHAHSGIHAVAVVSGTLTVYDDQCRAQTFEPGRPYVGGQELHLVRNESGSPVEMAVTYLNPSTGNGPTRHLPAPSGCVGGRY